MLQREGGLRPGIVRSKRVSRWLATASLAAGALVIAGASSQRKQPRQMSKCEHAVRNNEPRHGVDFCLASYQQTGDPFFLRWTAEAYLRLNQFERASEHARRLLSGPHDADGHRILSDVFLRTKPANLEKVREHASAALAIYKRKGDERGQTSTALTLSRAAWKLGDFTETLDAADQALRLAVRLDDARSYEMWAHQARADALHRMGDVEEARAALEKASERATDPCDKMRIRFNSGLLELELGSKGSALYHLMTVEKENRDCLRPDVAIALDLTMAWILRETDPADARKRLDALAKHNSESLETLLLRGYLAADRGALAVKHGALDEAASALDEAADYLAQAAAAEELDADWMWEVELARAQLAELRGGRFSDLIAEYHYRRAIHMVAKLRSNARPRAAYFVSSHRGPYDGLIALLARTGRWQDALAVILELDASDMLRATAAEVRSFEREPLIPGSLAPGPGMVAAPPASVKDVLAAWRSRDLVIVIAPESRRIGRKDERVYRLRITGGQVVGEDVGDADAARKWAGELYEAPAHSTAARRLGALIVPHDRTAETLDVLAIGPLGKAPLAALRDPDGSLISSRRPLARVLALRAAEPSPSSTEAPAVLADPEGNLFNAALEGYFVTSFLGGRARHSGAYTTTRATRERLREARHAELLHIASHVGGERGSERALRLADGAVTPDEIVKDGLAPQLAVLASCGSAAALDEEGWGSLAAALLQAGTRAVIATDRSIPDTVSFALMRAFYAQPDWRTDPVRALARVQHAASTDPATYGKTWAAFTVLRRPPDPRP